MGVEELLRPPRPTRSNGKPEGRERGPHNFAAGNAGEQVLARERRPWEQKQELGGPEEPHSCLLSVSSPEGMSQGTPVKLGPGEGGQGV